MTDDPKMTVQETETSLLVTACRIYKRPFERAAMRGALADAAILCDAIAREIVTGGRPSKARRDLAALATRCGDHIMTMRDKIEVLSND